MSRNNGAVKAKRQQAILGLVSRERLARQEEIRARLAYLGIDATQSTISRDVEELGLARVHDHDGLRYVVPGDGAAPTDRWRCCVTCSTSSRSRSCASGAGLIVRTPPGAAAALAEGIDRAGLARRRGHDRRRQHDPDPRPRGREAARARAVAHPDHGGSTAWSKAVLAYSGGLDTSVTIRWLGEQGYEVHAVAVDVGQREDFDEIVERGEQAGAASVRVVDAVDRFAAEFLAPAIKANGLYEGKYPMVSGSRGRDRRGGREGRARDRRRRRGARLHRQGQRPGAVRGRRSACSLPTSQVLAPIRDAEHPAREGDRAGRASGASRSRASSRPYSVDENLWGRTAECGPLEDPWVAPPEDAFERTASPADRPDRARRGRRRLRARAAGGARRRGGDAARADPRARRAGRWVLRVRAGRHDREPAGGHQEPRAVRGAGRAGDHPGAPGAGGPHAGARPRPPQAADRAALGRPGLRRPVVHPAARTRSTPTSTRPRRT